MPPRGGTKSPVADVDHRRWSSSGIHWRPGVIVTAEEVLERLAERVGGAEFIYSRTKSAVMLFLSIF